MEQTASAEKSEVRSESEGTKLDYKTTLLTALHKKYIKHLDEVSSCNLVSMILLYLYVLS
jgi:hypothetical protein